jgi:hypothetical protein
MLLLESTLHTFILLGSIIPPCAGLARSTIQLDVIFPRNGSVYKPTWPFPIVFAVHNLDRVWKLQPQIDWFFSGPWNADGRDPRWSNFGVWDESKYHWAVNSPPNWPQKSHKQDPAPPPTFVIVNGTKVLHHEIAGRDPAPGKYKLQFFVLFGNIHPMIDENINKCMAFQNDSARMTVGNVSQSTPFRIVKEISFEISAKGTLPDVLSGGKCPQALGTVSIPSLYLENGTTECPQYTADPPKGEDCLYQIDGSLNANVKKQMLHILDCNETEYSWPNTTFNNLSCFEARRQAAEDGFSAKFAHKSAASTTETLAWYNIALLTAIFVFGFSLL